MASFNFLKWNIIQWIFRTNTQLCQAARNTSPSYILGNVGGSVVSGSEKEIGDTGSNSSRVQYNNFHTIILKKGMNPYPIMGFLCYRLNRNQAALSTCEWKSDWNKFEFQNFLALDTPVLPYLQYMWNTWYGL